MNVLSLFDGMSCGRIALKRAGIPVEKYFSSEVDKHAIKVANYHNPQDEEHRLGDVSHVDGTQLPKIDLLIGGSPCTSFSFSGTRKGMVTKDDVEITTLDQYLELKDQGFEFKGQSYLFWEYIRLLNETKPKYFLLENVKMSNKWQDVLSKAIGCEPIVINSSLVSAQNRVRLYWTNIPNIDQPEDTGAKLVDILDNEDMINPSAIRGRRLNKATIVGRRLNDEGKREDSDTHIPITQCLEVRGKNKDKSNCLTTVAKDNVLTTMPIGRHPDAFKNELPFRYYTTPELCRLQTVPDNYFNDVTSNNQARKMLGNGWTVDVIAHIFKHIER
jgi:DNA-cytosine methyltransferase